MQLEVGQVSDSVTVTADAGTLSNANVVIQPRYSPAPFRCAMGDCGSMQPQFDMSLAKNTAITERISVQFRAELFNVFNTY